MLGYRPLGSGPLGSSGNDQIYASSTATLGELTSDAAVLTSNLVTADQTLGELTQFCGENSVGSADQTLGALRQSTVIRNRIRGAVDGALSLVTSDAQVLATNTARSNSTLGALTQTTAVSVYFNLPDCGWIKTAGNAVDALLRHLPQGAAWLAWRWSGKMAYKLMKALSGIYDDAMTALCNLSRELDPRTTVEMIGEWETALGLPDACLPEAHTLDERRRNIWFRLQKRRWSTAKDWHALAAQFGLEIIITPGWLVQKPALYPACYPKRYDLFPKLGRFRVYIDIKAGLTGGYDYGKRERGPGYPVPYGFQAQRLDAFMCLIDRVRPAHVIVIWNKYPGQYACVPKDGV